MIIAVRIEAIILFHSNDDIGELPPVTRMNYHASGEQTNRASCRWPIGCQDIP